MFLFSAVAAFFFFGGFESPMLDLGNLPSRPSERAGIVHQVMAFLTIVTKAFAGVFVMMWLRWTLPRVRIDQVMTMGYKYLTPLSLLCVLGAGRVGGLDQAPRSGWPPGVRSASPWAPSANYVKNVVDSLKTTLVGMKITGQVPAAEADHRPVPRRAPADPQPLPGHPLPRAGEVHLLPRCARGPARSTASRWTRSGTARSSSGSRSRSTTRSACSASCASTPAPRTASTWGRSTPSSSFDRSEFVHDLLSWTRAWPVRPRRMIEAEKKKAAKEAAKKAKAEARRRPREVRAGRGRSSERDPRGPREEGRVVSA